MASRHFRNIFHQASGQSSGDSRFSNMSTGLPCERVLHNGIGSSRIGNPDQVFRFLGYPHAQVNNSEHLAETPTSFSQGMHTSSGPALGPRANSDRDRRSSGVSPKTVRLQNQPQHCVSPVLQEPVLSVSPPASAAFGDTIQQPNRFRPASLSSISSVSITTGGSIFVQKPFFDLLEAICTEAARRKWHAEVERRLILNLSSRRERMPDCSHCQSRRYPTSRYEPYRGEWTPKANAEAQQMPRYGLQPSLKVIPQHQRSELRFMDYIRRIASALWENAQALVHNDGSEAHRAESMAIEEMKRLYDVGANVVKACGAAGNGNVFSLEELKDITVSAKGWCRFLGYEEGRARCDELVRKWAVWEEQVV